MPTWIDKAKGYLILLLSLFIFTMWGLNLFALADREEDEMRPGGPGDRSPVVTEMHTLYRRPHPFLYYYLEEVGFSVRSTSAVPRNFSDLLIMVEPSDRLPQLFTQDLLDWVRDGGSVLLFVSQPHPLATHVGCSPASAPSSLERETRRICYPWLTEADAVSTLAPTFTREPGMSLPSLYLRPTDDTVVYQAFRGRGQIIACSGHDFSSPQGLARADNVVFITRTVERLSGNTTVYFYDPQPDHVLKSRVKTVREGRTIDMVKVKVRKPYLSFWSLVKANPVSWVLVQMLLALIVYFYGLARRFSRPLPLSEPMGSVGHFISGMARLYESQGSTAFAARRLLDATMATLRPRLGLPAATGDLRADVKAMGERLAASQPERAQALTHTLDGLARLATSNTTNDDALVAHARALIALRKELNIHE